MKRILLLIAAAVLSIQCLAGELVNRTVLHRLISIDMPAEFTQLDQETMAFKYPRGIPPREGYGNAAASVTIVFGPKRSVPLTANELPDLQAAMTKGFSNPNFAVRWHQNKIMKINGRDWLVMEFTSPAIDTQIRNLMAMTSVDGKMVVASFNTTTQLARKWMPVGRQMINSIRINPPENQP